MTTFKGFKNGFGNGGAATKFCGRGSVPEGPLKRVPTSTANISNGNRRLGKTNTGDGGGSGTRFGSRTSFGGKSK